MSEAEQIVPSLSRQQTYEMLTAEAAAHMAAANALYIRALAVHAAKGSSHHLMQRVIIEQNAALLCQQQQTQFVLALVVTKLDGETDDSDEGFTVQPGVKPA